jgi:hypothetical protein
MFLSTLYQNSIKPEPMKTSILFLFLGLSTLTFAQMPTVNIVVEEMPMPGGLIPSSGLPYRTYRLYLEPTPNWELLTIYGLQGSSLVIETLGDFYQDPLGGPTSLDIDEALIPSNPSLAFDSWLTIGAESSLNNLLFSLPLDGSVFNDWELGNDLIIDDIIGGSVAIPSPGMLTQNVPDANGRILIAQLTSNSTISGHINSQFRLLNEDGSIFLPAGGGGPVTALVTNFFSIQYYDFCPSDFNSSGNVDISDLLIFLSNFGCSGDCIADLTGDNATTVADMLQFLSEIGQSCLSEF